jgi:hypothetical protein
MESLAEPSIFPILIACSIFLAIHTTSCQSSNVVVVVVVLGLLETSQYLGNPCSAQKQSMWNHTLSKLEENLMNRKLFCLIFDCSQTVQQTDTCRGSSPLLKFQSSSCCLVKACLFSLLLYFNADTSKRKL